MKIGEQLQRQRKMHKMSQDTLADKLHISRQSISKWENGVALPSFANVVAISELFDISLDELIKGDTDLMYELKNKGRWMSKTKFVIVVSLVSAFTVVILARLFNGGWSNIEDLLAIPTIIAFVGLLISIPWKEFDRILNRKTILWGIIWITLSIAPIVNAFIAGFIQGFSEH